MSSTDKYQFVNLETGELLFDFRSQESTLQSKFKEPGILVRESKTKDNKEAFYIQFPTKSESNKYFSDLKTLTELCNVDLQNLEFKKVPKTNYFHEDSYIIVPLDQVANFNKAIDSICNVREKNPNASSNIIVQQVVGDVFNPKAEVEAEPISIHQQQPRK